MRILIATPYYAPDLGPSSPLLTMLAESLVTLNHQVIVLAAVPHFPSGHVSAEYRKGLWQWDTLNGVRVCRVRVPSGERSNLFHRLLAFLIFQVLTSLIGLRQQYDVVLVTNPALETFLPFVLLGWLRRKPTVFAVWDLYPEVGVRLGIFRSRLIIAIVGAMENFCLRHAARIQVLSPAFASALVSRGIPDNKITEILPWIDTDFIQPGKRQNAFSRENGLDSKFVLLYAGNLGFSQELETLLLAAKALSVQPHIHFVLLGDGPNREKLVNMAHESALSNVSFLSFQPRERLPEVLAAADVALVSLKKGIGDGSLPSKTFPILASGRPIVAVIEEAHDLWHLVEQSGAGICVPPGDPQALAQAVLWLEANPDQRRIMGQKGHNFAIKRHSRLTAAHKFENLFLSALGRSRNAPSK